MRKKKSLTIVEHATILVPEFESVYKRLSQQVSLRGQSSSTLNNYIRRIALFVIHFERLPEQVSEDESNEYLVALARDPKSPSRSSFKHMVYGLRYYYRILPLSPTMAIGLKKYLGAENPHIWLFNGKQAHSKYSTRGLSWDIRENLKKTSITKKVNLHSLRHSYATHLLEQGVNIVSLKELLGHSEITTTMIYLHVAQFEFVKPHSPLDTLYGRFKK